MTQCLAMLDYQRGLKNALEASQGFAEYVPGGCQDKWPEKSDLQLPMLLFGPATAENMDACGASAGSRTSTVRQTLELVADCVARADALVVGDRVELALASAVVLESSRVAVGAPDIKMVSCDVDTDGYWVVRFELEQIVDDH
jgi:hypothetical protein